LSVVEHVHLGVLVSNLIASSDNESDDMDYQEQMELREQATMAA
jgi:hypothetical protein